MSLKKLLPGISSTVLADRLFELEREGLVSKKIYPENPPKVEYNLTLRAKELRVILKELGTWASRWKVPRITTKTKSTGALTLYEQSLINSSQNSKFIEAYDLATILLIIGAGLGGISEIAKNKLLGYPSLIVGGSGVIVLLLTTFMPSIL
jgi:hypothetical protein